MDVSLKFGIPLLLVGLAGCPKPAAPQKAPTGPRHRLLLKVTKGTFSPALESRLEAELLLALANQPELEVISQATADDVARRRHVCAEDEFPACRSRLLQIEGEVGIELKPGAVRGTWFFDHSLTPTGGARLWQPTLPFSAAQGETFDDAVVRAARQLGAALTWTGVKAGTNFPPAPATDDRLVSLCGSLNDPGGLEVEWPTRLAVRAELHRAGQDNLAENAIGELAIAAHQQAEDPCARLAALDAWRDRATQSGWLPRQLASERWRADMDLVLRREDGSGFQSRALVSAVSGALAVRGYTLRNAGPREPGEPCVGKDCLEGEDTSDVTPTLGRLVIDVVEGQAAMKLRGRIYLRAADGEVRAIAVAPHELGVSGSTGALDRAIDSALAALDSPAAPAR